MRLTELLANVKFRVFQIGDKIHHRDDEGKIFTIKEKFLRDGKNLILLKESQFDFLPHYWSKVNNET